MEYKSAQIYKQMWQKFKNKFIKYIFFLDTIFGFIFDKFVKEFFWIYSINRGKLYIQKP